MGMQATSPSTSKRLLPTVMLGLLVMAGLYVASLHSYLLFHGLTETFSIVVACGVFMIAWNSRRVLDNSYLLLVGIGYLFVAGLDFVHALAYKGMPIFATAGSNLATQLWISARAVQAGTMLIAPLLIGRRFRPSAAFLAYSDMTAFLLAAIFAWHIFPVCYVEGAGLTSFKVWSEYAICGVLLASAGLLYAERRRFDRPILYLLLGSLAAGIASEIAFTEYVGVYGTVNMVGHLLKIVAFYLIYKALIETGLVRPYALLLRDLKLSEEALRAERDRARNYLRIAGVIFLVIGRDERVALINAKGCELLGYGEDEIVGRNWFDAFIPQRMHEQVRAVFREMIAGRTELAEYHESPVLAGGGVERTIAWHNTLLRDDEGAIIGTLSSGEDVTERNAAQEALRQARDDLERRVQERTAELTEANVTLRAEVAERRRADQKLADYEAQLRSMAAKVSLAEEQERRRIASELHDRIGQALAVSKIKLGQLKEAAAAAGLDGPVGEVRSLIDQTIRDTRSLTFDLSPPVLYELGLRAAIEWLAERLQEQHKIRIILDDANEPIRLSDETGVLLFRAAQELLMNVVKHSHATVARLSLHMDGREVRISVEDDGVGFDVSGLNSQAHRQAGFGIFSIRERLRLLDGRLEIESAPGKGTRATIVAAVKADTSSEGDQAS